MASHHHLCHHPAVAATSACHCCYTPCHNHHHPPPQPYHYQNPPNLPHMTHFRHFEEERPNYPSVASLLRRIDTLESALYRRSSSHSLRDAAARTIQTYFRSFLCRRSKTLRHLKDLAAIKSALSLLKSSSHSKRSPANYDVIYHRAVNLLLRLDAIQDSDPLIRNGKTSLSMELNKFLDLIDGVRVGTKSRVSKSEIELGNMKIGNLKEMNVVKIRALVERINKLAEEIDGEEGEVTVKPKNLTRRRNEVLGIRPEESEEKVYRVLRRPYKPSMVEYCDDEDDSVEDSLCPEIDEMGLSPKEEEDEEEGESTGKPNKLTTRKEGILRNRPEVKKGVSFVENGKVYRVLRRLYKPSMVEYCDDRDDSDPEIDEIGLSMKEEDDEDDNDEEEDESTGKPNNLTTRKKGILRNRPEVKKSVSFVENGKVYRVLRRSHKPSMVEYCNEGDNSVEDSLCREIEEIGVSTKEEDDDEEDEEEVEATIKPNNLALRKKGILGNRQQDEDDDEEDEEEGEATIKPNNLAIRKKGILGNRQQDCLVRPEVKKGVTFVENGKVYRVLRRPHKPLMKYCDDRDESYRMLTNDEDDDEEVHLDREGVGSSYGGELARSDRDDGGNLVFHTPSPMKMES